MPHRLNGGDTDNIIFTEDKNSKLNRRSKVLNDQGFEIYEKIFNKILEQKNNVDSTKILRKMVNNIDNSSKFFKIFKNWNKFSATINFPSVVRDDVKKLSIMS